MREDLGKRMGRSWARERTYLTGDRGNTAADRRSSGELFRRPGGTVSSEMRGEIRRRSRFLKGLGVALNLVLNTRIEEIESPAVS